MTDAVAITLITTIGTGVSTLITTLVVVFSKRSTHRRINQVQRDVTDIRNAQNNGAPLGDRSIIPPLSDMKPLPPARRPARHKGE
jgi:hypothetical protein